MACPDTVAESNPRISSDRSSSGDGVRRLSSARLVVATAAATALCAVTAGCTAPKADDPAQPPSSPTSAAASSSPAPVTLRFAVYGGPEQVASYQELAEAFEKNNPYATVKVESTASAGASSSRLRTQLAAGTAPDVFLTEHDKVPALVQAGSVKPVDELLEAREVDFGDGYHRDGLEAFSKDSALQCMPHDVSPMVVYYNTDLVRFDRLVEPETDPPTAEDGWTWDQFAAAARQIARRGNAHGVHIEPSLEMLAPFIWSAGGDLVDDTQEPTSLDMDSDDTREAFELVLGLVRDPNVTPTQAELARQDAVSQFAQGKIGMVIGSRELTPRLRAAKGLDFEVFPLPHIGPFRTISSMNGYCIAAGTDKVQAAADFLAFAVGREGATITTTAGYVVPSNLEVAHSPAFTQPGLPPKNSFVFNEGVRRTEPTPFVPEWPRVVNETDPVIERLFYAPVIDLDAALISMDTRSQQVFVPEDESAEPE